MLVIVTVIFFFAFRRRSVFFGFSRFGELQLVISNCHNFLIGKHAFQHLAFCSKLRTQLDTAAFERVAASHKNKLFAAITQNGFDGDGQNIGRLGHLDGQNDLRVGKQTAVGIFNQGVDVQGAAAAIISAVHALHFALQRRIADQVDDG